MKIKLWHILVLLFIVFSLTDYITTFMGIAKHGVEYEGNVISAITGSFTFFILFKTVLTAYLTYVLYKGYFRIKFPVVRYIFIYIVCILVVLLFVASVNNYKISQIDHDEIPRPLTKQEKIDNYKGQLASGASVDPTIVSKSTNDKTGLGTFIFNVIQFLFWRSFEKRNIVIISKARKEII